MIVFNEDLVVSSGSTLKWAFYVLDNSSVSIDLTVGYAAKLQIRTSMNHTSLLVLDCTAYLDLTTFASTGVIVLIIPHTVTDDIREGYYDLKLQTPNGEVYTISHGKVKLDPFPTVF